MNFISTFDELNKLYEEADVKKAEKIEEAYKEELTEALAEADFDKVITKLKTDLLAEIKPTPVVEIGEFYDNTDEDEASFKDIYVSWEQWADANYYEDAEFEAVWKKAIEWLEKNAEKYPGFRLNVLDPDTVEYFITVSIFADDVKNESLREASEEDEEIEIVDDEDAVAEEPAAEEEPKQTIIECSKCGALVIVDEVEVDEESDLVNVKDECKFCEEKEGFKIVGLVVPYEAPEAEEEPVEDELAEEDEIVVEEGLDDIARKVFDRPASTRVQQDWEDELNGSCGEISDKRRKQLEKKFDQQRDWEARHPDKEVK